MLRSSHILVCDPDPSTASAIEAYLSANGSKVTLAEDADRLEHIVQNDTADFVVLDFGLDGADPLALARRLSERTRMGILMLTQSADPIERICSLEAGADDCLMKPLDLRELLARLKAIQRRMSKAVHPIAPKGIAGDLLTFGSCFLDLASRTLRDPQGRVTQLTEMEIALLKIFVQHPNQALNRDEIAELAYGRTWTPFDRSLDIRISRLRRKIERDPARPETILTVRGIGYRYEARAMA
ncbi:MAG: winged helix-turn-helix domain-containing protein [Hyphomicrobiaceae bacterium]